MKHVLRISVIVFLFTACHNEQLIGPQVKKHLLEGEWLQITDDTQERRIVFSTNTYQIIVKDSKTQTLIGDQELKFDWLDGHRFKNEKSEIFIVDELSEDNLVFHVEGMGHLKSEFLRVKK